DHVEPGFDPHPHCRDKLTLYLVHVRAGHRPRLLIGRRPRYVRGGNDGPIALDKREVVAVPAQPGRSFSAGMAELQADFGLAVGMDKIGDAPPRGGLLAVPHAGAARTDPPLWGAAGLFRE